MNEDMSSMIQNLSSMLNSKDMPEGIKDMVNNLKSNTDSQSTTSNTEDVSSSSTPNITPEMISNLMSAFNNSNKDSQNSTDSSDSSSGFNIDMETILKMKTIMEKMNSKDDPRSNLLLSLKPYLKPSRKDKVEQYIKLFNMSKVVEVFNPTGGDKKK